MTRVGAIALLVAVTGCGAPLLRPAEPVTGSLSTGQDQFEDGSYFREFLIDLRRGDTLTALLTSDDFDAMLLLEGWYGVPLTEDDDGGGECNARLVYVSPYGSVYRLYVTSANRGELGAFHLEIWKGSAPAPPSAPTQCSDFGEAAGTVLLGQTVAGRLDSTAVQRWTLGVAPGTRFTVDVASGDLDPRVTLIRSRGEAVAQDDDSGPGCGARLTYTAADARPLRILVNPSDTVGSQMGAYSLSVRSGARALDDAQDCQLGIAVDRTRITHRIAVGDSARGELSMQDTELPRDRTRAQWWRLDAARGADSATIDLVSDAFDAYLIVSGREIGALEDDDSGGSCHARVTLRLTPSSEYFIIVNTTTPGATGTFLLRVSPTPPPRLPGTCGRD